MIFLKRAGYLPRKNSRQADGRRFGVGLEKLDRSLYDPADAYDRLAATGARMVRIQSGWAKTETAKGRYDFGWLDEVADNLIKRGMEPWICLCYGNPLYDPEATNAFDSVACPPVGSEEAMEAWLAYSAATARHFRGRVSKYEIWNEPEWLWKGGSDPVAYGNFAARTAKALKEADPASYVIAGALTYLDADWAGKMLATGLGEYADAVSYHRYTAFPETLLEEVPRFRETLARHGVGDLINGESGCQSAPFGAGALAEGAWNEDIQTKLTLRRALIDLMTGLTFSSVFTAVDIPEALPGVTGQGYFGLMKNEIVDGKITGRYLPKPSYFAYSHFVSAFEGEFTREDFPVTFHPSESPRLFSRDEDGSDFVRAGFRRRDGSAAFAWYKPTNVMTTSFSSTVSFSISGVSGEPKLIDLRDGSLYAFDDRTMEVGDGVYHFSHVPVRDYPLALLFGAFVRDGDKP